MRDDLLARYTGAFTAVGGGTWAVAHLLQAALYACRSPRCPLLGVYPTLMTLVELLFMLSLMLLSSAGVGLVILVGRQGALRLLGAIPAAVGAVACAVGFALLWVGVAFSEGPANPYLDAASAGGFAVLLGLTLVACVLLGVRGRPRGVGGFLLGGALLLASATNESMPALVLLVASGMSWCGAGALLLLPSPRPPVVTAALVEERS